MASLQELDRLPADWPGIALDRVLAAVAGWEGGNPDPEQLSYLNLAAPGLLFGPKAMAFREKMKEQPALAYAALSMRQGHSELASLYSALRGTGCWFLRRRLTRSWQPWLWLSPARPTTGQGSFGPARTGLRSGSKSASFGVRSP